MKVLIDSVHEYDIDINDRTTKISFSNSPGWIKPQYEASRLEDTGNGYVFFNAGKEIKLDYEVAERLLILLSIPETRKIELAEFKILKSINQ